MLNPKFIASSSALFAILALAASASANCARPVSYSANVSGNKVTIEPFNFVQRGCPDSAGMLRQNIATGEIVKLDDYCATSASSERLPAYVDECVPAGSYRYGFATPYTCAPSSCSTDFYAVAKVDSVLDANCARSSGNDAPTPAATVPWNNVANICLYQSKIPGAAGFPNVGIGGLPTINAGGSSSIMAPPGGQYNLGGSSSGGASNVGGSSNTAGSAGTSVGKGGSTATNQGGSSGSTTTNKAGTAGSTVTAGSANQSDTDDDSESDSGCSIAAPAGSSSVLAINLLAIVTGLLLRRSRNSRRP